MSLESNRIDIENGSAYADDPRHFEENYTEFDYRYEYINEECSCGNPEMGFNCSCEHEKNNPGDIEFSCEFCGIYTASKAKCNKCYAEEF